MVPLSVIVLKRLEFLMTILLLSAPPPPPLETASVLPPLQSTTMHSPSDVLFDDETTLGLIRAFNSNKSS